MEFGGRPLGVEHLKPTFEDLKSALELGYAVMGTPIPRPRGVKLAFEDLKSSPGLWDAGMGTRIPNPRSHNRTCPRTPIHLIHTGAIHGEGT